MGGPSDDPKSSPLKDIMSGTMGGIAQVLAGHPLDTVKTKMQLGAAPGEAPYKGMADVVTRTMQHGGMRALYAGATSPLAGAMAHNAGLFFFYGAGKQVVERTMPRGDAKTYLDRPFPQLWAAGALAGSSIAVIEAPVDLFKIKMQGQDPANPTYTSVSDCAKKTISQYGARGFFQGTTATAVRNVPAFGMYFGTFEVMRRTLTKEGERPSLLSSTIAGGCAGGAFWGPAYPLEVIKTRLQMDSLDPAVRRYTGILDCFRQSVAEGGVASLYRGFTPCMVRAVVVNSAIFCAVTTTKQMLGAE